MHMRFSYNNNQGGLLYVGAASNSVYLEFKIQLPNDILY